MGSDFDLRDLLKPHLSPALPALEMDKSIGRSTWSQYNSKNADLSSLTYHQHYPTLEMDKSIGTSNLNMRPCKPPLPPWCWRSQHQTRQDYCQVHKWKWQNTAQSLGKVATWRLNHQSQRRWPPGLLTNTSSTHGERVGIFLLSTAPHRREVLLHWIMVLLWLDMSRV